MEAVARWLLDHGAWGLVILMLFYDRWRFNHGDVVSSRSVDWMMQGQRDLATAVERIAESQDKNTDAVMGVQASVRDLEEGMRTQLHALESIQKHSGGTS